MNPRAVGRTARRRLQHIGLLACAALGLAVPVLAQEMPMAVGRITYGAPHLPGSPLCTGALISADLVLTAAHCVISSAPARIRFEAGYSAGKAKAIGLGAEVLLDPALPKTRPVPFAQDVALLRLSAPIDPAVVPPLSLGPLPAEGDLHFFGYSRDAAEVRPAFVPCPIAQVSGAGLLLGCVVVSGHSGAPVLAQDVTGVHIVGVMVARAGAGLALTALPGDWITTASAR